MTHNGQRFSRLLCRALGVSALLPALLSLTLAASGCGSDPQQTGSSSGSNDTENLGEVQLDLASIPSGIVCISATFGSATRNVTVSAGQTSVNLTQLPIGTMTLDAKAYNVACSSIATATPTWLADTQTWTIQPGVYQPLSLVFRQYSATQANANFLPTVVKVATSGRNTALLLANGDVSYWGDSNSLPARRLGLTGAIDMGLGEGWGCALKSDGSVWCWGSGQSGQLGAGTALTFSATPVRVTSTVTFAKLFVGPWHACAATAYSAAAAVAGTYQVFCWGRNFYGQLGDGTQIDRFVPTSISPIGIAFALGNIHTCAVTAAGQVKCWGHNGMGQFGLGTSSGLLLTPNSATPATGLRGIVKIVAGEFHNLAIDASGQAFTWGYNSDADCGVGHRLSPVTTPTYIWGGVASGSDNCVVTTSQRLLCWGDNKKGQAGAIYSSVALTPQALFGGGIVGVGHGALADHTCALTSNGDVLCWGLDDYGQVTGRPDLNQYIPYAVTNW